MQWRNERLTAFQAKGCVASSQAEYQKLSEQVKEIRVRFLFGDYSRGMAISALCGKLGYGIAGATTVVNKWFDTTPTDEDKELWARIQKEDK